MKQKYILGIVALSLVAVLGVSMISAFGFGKGGLNADLTDEEKAEIQEDRQTMRAAIENNDYSTWKTLMEERLAKMQEQITEENFNKLVERHSQMSEFRTALQEAKESGDWSEVEALKADMDFEGSGFKKGFKQGSGFGFKQAGGCQGGCESGGCPFAK